MAHESIGNEYLARAQHAIDGDLPERPPSMPPDEVQAVALVAIATLLSELVEQVTQLNEWMQAGGDRDGQRG